MPDIDDDPVQHEPRSRGRRAASQPSKVATLVDPILPALAAVAAWLSAHRLAVLITVTGVVTIGAIAGGAAFIRFAAPMQLADEQQVSGNVPRPTSTDPAGPSLFGPILPTSTPAPKPTSTPKPTTEPGEVVAPIDEPVVEPEPEPSPTTEPGEPPGNSANPNKGTKKPKG